MIDGNTLKFGFGDIAVSANFNALLFQSFRPPQEIGTLVHPDTVERMSEKIRLVFENFDLADVFRDRIYMVAKGEISVFEFEGFIFDFSNSDGRSINTLMKHFNNAVMWLLVCSAC